MIRYHKETAFYKQVENWVSTYDVAELNHAELPLEKIVYESLMQQTKYYKQDVGKYQKKIEQEQDEMLSWIHEVKTPLTTMKLMIERMSDVTLKKQLMVEWLRIDLLLDQQLHQKRIRFIENDVYIEHIALQALINTEIKNVQSWCMQKGIGFDLSFEVKEVLSDAKWLGFIIRQLITNAIKYSIQSDISIKSYSRNNQINIDVTDTGRGIDPKDLPRIFDKGFTSTTDHREAAATGMGLYLVRKVTETLLIQIDVKSKRDVGTTFTLTFPNKNEVLHIKSM